jgi:hypothetical protein
VGGLYQFRGGRQVQKGERVLTDSCECIEPGSEEEAQGICSDPPRRRSPVSPSQEGELKQPESGDFERRRPNEMRRRRGSGLSNLVIDLYANAVSARFIFLRKIVEERMGEHRLIEPEGFRSRPASERAELACRSRYAATGIPGNWSGFGSSSDGFGVLQLMVSQDGNLRRESLSVCSRERIPILTYCSPVVPKAFKDFGVLCDPEYWLEALDDHPDLVLCHGHGGGGRDHLTDVESGGSGLSVGWFSRNGEEWADERNFARKVVEQCCRFRQVFCDYSGFGPMLEDHEKVSCFKHNLITALGGPAGDLHFGNKIMYGSEWRVLGSSEDDAGYLAFWKDLFDDPLLLPFRDAFFFKNAQRFLGCRTPSGT